MLSIINSFFLLLFFAVSILSGVAHGHGFLFSPRPRGCIKNCYNERDIPSLMPSLPKTCSDWSAHFPAGDKTHKKPTGEYGWGLKSQIKAAGGKWTPYEPTKPGFIFRSGVCGDLKKGVDAGAHMRGGRFYCPPENPFIPPGSVYQQGGVIEATVQFATHHNGFMELRVCDVKRCGGEISEKCLRSATTCRTLKRTKEAECESGTSMRCGPIDSNYPTRFYLPCSKTAAKSEERMGGIRFDLPSDLNCEHCVLQWYYAAANDCNPPGLWEYFTGKNKPSWGDCPGQGGARGGYRPNWHTCGERDEDTGKEKFSEEYYSCSDIAIKAVAQRGPTPTNPPEEQDLVRKKGVTLPTATPTPVVVARPSPAAVAPRTAAASVTRSPYLVTSTEAPELTPEPGPISATLSELVAYVEISVGKSLYKIYDGQTRTFRTGGAFVKLNAVVFGEKPRKVLFKVQSYGSKVERYHPYTYTFPRGRNRIYNRKPMAIRIEATASDGKVYVTRFTLQLF